MLTCQCLGAYFWSSLKVMNVMYQKYKLAWTTYYSPVSRVYNLPFINIHPEDCCTDRYFRRVCPSHSCMQHSCAMRMLLGRVATHSARILISHIQHRVQRPREKRYAHIMLKSNLLIIEEGHSACLSNFTRSWVWFSQMNSLLRRRGMSFRAEILLIQQVWQGTVDSSLRVWQRQWHTELLQGFMTLAELARNLSFQDLCKRTGGWLNDGVQPASFTPANFRPPIAVGRSAVPGDFKPGILTSSFHKTGSKLQWNAAAQWVADWR